MIIVSTDEICAAIQDIFEDNRSIVEPAGALPVAGIKRYVAREQCRDRRFVAINCGANMNFDRLRHVAERADIGGQREALVAVEIPERKGSFLQFCEMLGRRNVTEFNYRYDDGAAAQLFVGLALAEGRKEKEALLASLREAGYPVVDMSDNEVAKLHVRYMVGGRGRGIEHERLFRFEFPERPGALLKFLHAIGTQWNITLFHYRNHGSDHGRVLAGVQVPPQESVDFDLHVRELKYVYAEETDNPAYRMFLLEQRSTVQLSERLARSLRDHCVLALRLHQDRVTLAQQLRCFVRASLRHQHSPERAVRCGQLRTVGRDGLRRDLLRSPQRLFCFAEAILLQHAAAKT